MAGDKMSDNQAQLCADCKHHKDDPTMHLDAPGEDWGAALHWYVAPEPLSPAPDLEGIARELEAVTQMPKLSEAARTTLLVAISTLRRLKP